MTSPPFPTGTTWEVLEPNCFSAQLPGRNQIRAYGHEQLVDRMPTDPAQSARVPAGNRRYTQRSKEDEK